MLIIILNIVSALSFAGYFFFTIFGPAMAGMYNTSGVHQKATLWDQLQGLSVVLLAIVTLLAFTAYFVQNKRIATIFAASPILLAIIMWGAFYFHSLLDNTAFDENMMPAAIKMKEEDIKVLRETTKDYIETDALRVKSFLTVDKEYNVIVFIFLEELLSDEDVNKSVYSIAGAVPVGKINGNELELYSKGYAEEEDGMNIATKKLFDRNGKNIFDNYKLSYKGVQESSYYHLEKYIDPSINQNNLSNVKIENNN